MIDDTPPYHETEGVSMGASRRQVTTVPDTAGFRRERAGRVSAAILQPSQARGSLGKTSLYTIERYKAPGGALSSAEVSLRTKWLSEAGLRPA